MQGPCIHEVVSVPVHIQCNVSVDRPSQQGYTSGPLGPKAHIDVVSLNGWNTDTCWWPSIEIHCDFWKGCTSVTLNDFLKSHSCTIFFRPQWCQRFDVLPDSRYLWSTCQRVVQENTHLTATSEMLCPISLAQMCKLTDLMSAPDTCCHILVLSSAVLSSECYHIYIFAYSFFSLQCKYLINCCSKNDGFSPFLCVSKSSQQSVNWFEDLTALLNMVPKHGY